MDETAIAFERPYARSLQTATVDPLDRISVRDYLREIEIGAFQSERGVTQRIRFNVVLEVSHTTAAQDDDVDKVLSYDTITEAIDYELAAERINLLETLAERIAARCLEDRRAIRVFVRIEKLDRIPGTLGVEIVRTRADGAVPIRPQAIEAEPEDTHPHPLVIYLSKAVIDGEALESWLDAIEAAGMPAIICVPAVEHGHVVADHAMVQRRIDLLAIEQNAWVLAGRDGRCVVVNSRTELDWAMKHGRLSVWAPSKIVLDAVEKPKVSVQDTEALALWFAEQMEAARFVVVGDAAAATELKSHLCIELMSADQSGEL